MSIRRLVLLLIALSVFWAAGTAQEPRVPPADDNPRMPNGKTQKEEILKADYEKSLEDAAELVKVAEDFKAELEKNDRHVLSVTSLKRLDDIEKLTKRLRSRMKRY